MCNYPDDVTTSSIPGFTHKDTIYEDLKESILCNDNKVDVLIRKNLDGLRDGIVDTPEFEQVLELYIVEIMEYSKGRWG